MSRILAFEEPVPRSEVREVARLLTDRFAGLTFQEIRTRVADAAAVQPAAERVLRVAAYVARKVFQSLWDRNLYVGGVMNMLDQPEFGIGTMRALLKTFEEKRQLIELLTTRAQASDTAQVVIGSEMPYQEMQETSLVAASYRFHDRVLGVLGIVGPRRMPYAKVVPLVEYTARLVSRRLTRLGSSPPLG
jgi:heat-inducible transcriptional repressor